jgi:histidyl-tRNA synthetase
MGGPRIESIGFAGGVERLAGLQQALGIAIEEAPLIYFITFDHNQMMPAMKIASELRKLGLIVHQDFSSNLGKSFRKADSMKAAFCLILGEDELRDGVIKCKDMNSGLEKIVPIEMVGGLFA